MAHASRWQIPSSGLIHKDGSWHASADRTLGPAWGLLAPLRAGAGAGWEIAAAPGAVFELTQLPVDEPRPVPLPRQGEPSHYLCMLRYDGEAGDEAASTQELAAALRMLWRLHGRELERSLVTAEPAMGFADGTPERATPFTFAFASCQYPAGMLDRLQAVASCQALARRFRGGTDLPTRLLLLGDQVYTDATYGLLDPTRLDDRYRMPYEQSGAHDGPLRQLPQDFRRVLRMMPDDHEIADNWEPRQPQGPDERLERGLAAYWLHQRGETAPPEQVWITEPQPAEEPGPGWRLFMADSRTSREYRSERTVHCATILGQPQTACLERWLAAAPPADLKIVTTAAMLLPRSRIHLGEPLRLDNWQGYPASLHRLLALLCDRDIRNVVFLSGDAHLACSAHVFVRNLRTGQEVAFESHHAPALYAPFPFANESRWNLLLADRFRFAAALQGPEESYECTVEAAILADGRDGCGLLTATRSGDGWSTAVEVLTAA